MWNIPIPMKLSHYLPAVVKNAPVRYHGDWNVTASPLAIVLMIIIVRVCDGQTGGKIGYVGILQNQTIHKRVLFATHLARLMIFLVTAEQ